ncbi:MAG: hypothetical protein MJ252_14170 [archaeon]|nr:hypothetical protein [archaeon]
MNRSFNSDLKYTFLKRVKDPVETSKVDSSFISEGNIYSEMLFPYAKTVKFQSLGEKLKNWNDIGLTDILRIQLHGGPSRRKKIPKGDEK